MALVQTKTLVYPRFWVLLIGFIALLIVYASWMPIKSSLAINTNDKFLSKLVLDIIVYVTTFYFLYSFFISLKKTKISEIIFLLPCFYFILMMSTLTMTEPRMNDTILIFLLYNFLTRFKKIQN